MIGTEWTKNTFSDPFEQSQILYFSVQVNEGGFSKGRDIIEKSALKLALEFALNYYNLETNDKESSFLANKCFIKEWYLAPDKNSKIKYLVGIFKEDFFSTFTVEKQFQIFEKPYKSFKIDKSGFEEFFEFLIKKVKDYQKDLTNWQKDVSKSNLYTDFNVDAKLNVDNGHYNLTTKFNGELFIQDIREFKKLLTNLLRNNQINEYVDLEVVYEKQKEQKVSYVLASDKPLLISNNVFKRKASTNNEMLSVFLDVEKDGENKYRLKDDENWETFMNKYIVPNVSTVLFQNNLVNGVYSNFKKGYDLYKGLPRSVSIPNIPNSKIKFDLKLKKSRDRESISDPVIDNIVRDIQVVFPTADTLDKLFDGIVDRIPIGELIKILLSCVDFPNFSFNFNFNFRFPRLPNIPVFDLYLYLAANLEEIFLNLAFMLVEKFFSYILDLLRKLCEDKRTVDTGSKPVPSLDNIPNYGDLNEILKNFIRDVFDSLTAVQICGLLNGEPTAETLDSILNLLEKPEYSLLKEQIFKTQSDIIVFFKNLGTIIDKTLFCQYSEESESSSPCYSKDILKEFTKQIYRENHDIPEDLLEEIANYRENLVTEFQEYASGMPQQIEESFNQSMSNIQNQEIELAGGENNVINSSNQSTIKIVANHFKMDGNKFDKKNFSNPEDYNSYYSGEGGGTSLYSLKITHQNDQKFQKVVAELERNLPAQNPLYYFDNFLKGVSFNLDDIKEKYSVSKKSLSQFNEYDSIQTQKDIVNDCLNKLEIVEYLIKTSPLSSQISYDYKYDKSLYDEIAKFPTAIRLESLVEPGENIDDYKNIYDIISSYITSRNVTSEHFKDFFDKISSVKQFKDGLK